MAYIDPFIRSIILSVKYFGIEQLSLHYVLPQQQVVASHEENEKTIQEAGGFIPVKWSYEPEPVVKDHPLDGD